MSIKKLRYLAIALMAVAVCACQKDPDTSDLEDDYLVYTAYDTGTTFSQFGTYFIPDSILVITTTDEAEYWKDADAMEIINTVKANMNADGYTYTADKTTADLGLQLTYVQDVSYFIDYAYPYWWWYYPFYWGPGYWGDWTDWYYPYVVYYGYTAGSLLTEMVNLTATQEGTSKLPVVWDSFVSGLLTSDDDVNMQRTVDGINQSFTQSPYLKKSVQ